MVLFVCSVEGGVALRASTNYQDRIGGIRGPDYGDQIDVDVVDNEWLRLLLPDRPAAWNSTAFLPRYNFFHGAPVYFREARPLYPDVGGTVNWACQRRAGDDDIMYRNSTFRFDRFEASVGLTAGSTALHGPERRRFAFPPLDGYTTFAAEQEGEWLHLTAPRYDNFYVPLLSETGAGPPLCFPRLALPPSPPSIPSPPSPPAPPSPPSPPAAPPSYPYGVALTPLYVEAERMAMVAVISSILTLFAAACCLHYRTRKRMANLLVSRDRAKMDLALVEHQAKTTIELGSLQPQDEEEASALASLSDMHAPPSSSVFPSLPPGPPSSGSGWGGDEDRLTPGRNPVPGLVRSRAQWVPLQGGGGGDGNPTSAASEARIEANVEPRLRSLYEAILSALQQPTWEAARPSLLPIIKVTAVDSEAAEKLEVAVKQLYVLARMHGRIEPERAYEKLSATCDELPAPIRVAIHGHLSRNVLTYGAVQSTIEGGLSLAPSDVPALLDRYRWQNDARRTHMVQLMTQCLRAVQDFQTEADGAKEQFEAAFEVEAVINHARKRVVDATQRALRKHGGASTQLNQAIIKALADKVESVVEAVATRSLEGSEERRRSLAAIDSLSELSLDEGTSAAGASTSACTPSPRYQGAIDRRIQELGARPPSEQRQIELLTERTRQRIEARLIREASEADGAVPGVAIS